MEETTLTLDPKKDGSGPSVTVTQAWNELARSTAAWSYEDEYFTVGEGSDITYTMSFDGGAPIRGHGLTFKTLGLLGLEWDPTVEIDEDGDGETDYFGKYVENRYYDLDNAELKSGGKYAGLVTYGTPHETGGHYTSEQTVRDYVGPEGYTDYYLDEVEFGIEDASIRIKKVTQP